MSVSVSVSLRAFATGLEARGEEAGRALADAFDVARSVSYAPGSSEVVALHRAERRYEQVKQRRRCHQEDRLGASAAPATRAPSCPS